MLTREGARQRVFLELRRICPVLPGVDELVILDDHTIERPWGWIYFYTSLKWQDGDPRFAIAGNGPYFVNRLDGTMRAVGTGQPLEDYLRQYEQELGGTEDPKLGR